jgi:hypothetical protein
MVKGLDVFRSHFAGYEDQYVLIGGTAATLAMAEAGLEFRATKDLDIVLHMEALTPAFGAAVWAFVEQGDYEIRQASETGRPVLYRFQKPVSAGFPAMIELFCRAPEGIRIAPGTHLAPISFDEMVASLSTILLDNEYYKFIIDGRRNVDGLPWIGAEQLIPLKGHAWLDLTARRAGGEEVDARNIRKHGNDVIRLMQLLAPDVHLGIAPRIADDLDTFLARLMADGTYDPSKIGVELPLAEVVDRLRRAYRRSGTDDE